MDLLGYSTSIFAALTRYPTAVDKGLMSIIENFILEELNLTKDCILAVKVLILIYTGPHVVFHMNTLILAFSPLLLSTSPCYPKNVILFFYHGAKVVFVIH